MYKNSHGNFVKRSNEGAERENELSQAQMCNYSSSVISEHTYRD